MGTNTIVKLKRKGENADTAPVLFTLSTAPSRELLDNLSLLYNGGFGFEPIEPSEYGYYTVLDDETITEIIKWYENEIIKLKKLKEENIMGVDRFYNQLSQVKSPETFNLIDEKINDLKEINKYLDDEINGITYLKSLWEFALRVLHENIDYQKIIDWELVYYIC